MPTTGSTSTLGMLRAASLKFFSTSAPSTTSERVTQCQRADLLRQVLGMAAHHRTERLAAAAEQTGARRAVTGAAGTLLGVHLLAGAPDLRAQLGLVRPALAARELPGDAALQDVGAGLEAEDRVRKLDRPRFLAVEGADWELHHFFSPLGLDFWPGSFFLGAAFWSCFRAALASARAGAAVSAGAGAASFASTSDFGASAGGAAPGSRNLPGFGAS